MLKKLMSFFDFRDAFYFGGLGMAGVGLCGFDWRLSLIVVGFCLAASAKFGVKHGNP